MFVTRPMIACLAIFSTVAFAQAQQRPDGPPPRIDVAKVLNIDAARAQKVEAILKASHDKRMALREQMGPGKDEASREAMRAQMRAIREDTDKQLAAVLSPEELKKLHDAMPRPPRRGDGGGPGKGSGKGPGY
jgi:hypothetical protein